MDFTNIFPNEIKAALIDMDGVLYDSMPHHAKAWHRMLAEQGITTDENEFYLYEGMTGPATINLIFKRERGCEVSPEEARELYARKTEIFKSFGQKALMPATDRMLQAFMDAKIPRVLVTGSGQASLLESIEKDYPGAFLPGMRVTALDVTHGKPDPEPYLKGAAIAGFDPKECIVVENAPLGVRAGKAAGCFTVAVTTGPIPREEFEKEGADLIFPNMGAFADWLESVLPKMKEPETGCTRILSDILDKAVEKLSPLLSQS